MRRRKISGLGGLLCFAAGCLVIVLAVTKRERDFGTMAAGGVLVALGLHWLGPRRR